MNLYLTILIISLRMPRNAQTCSHIDGKITANGKSPDTQLGNNAGKKIVKMISLIVLVHLSIW
jgi:hypothetical protein